MTVRAVLMAAIAVTSLLSCFPARGQAPYCDLNYNGQLDPYENAGLSNAARVEDLIKRMTLEEKVGALLNVDVVTGRAIPASKLPLELSSSMAAVEKQNPAVADDRSAPLYPAGSGLSLGPRRR